MLGRQWKTMGLVVLLALTGALPAMAKASVPRSLECRFAPENDLWREDNVKAIANITEEQFNQVIDKVVGVYAKWFDVNKAQLNVERNWSDGTVNAYAYQNEDNKWWVAMFGGLARRSEVTLDGFAMVMCHEIGHHLGGYPIKRFRNWPANEGQSDYFATQACARELWRDDVKENAEYSEKVEASAKAACDKQWPKTNDRNLCYRASMAGLSLGTLLAKLGGGSDPKFDSPDKTAASSTQDAHPAGQCRLDTYFHGALCTTAFDPAIIPGKGLPGDGQSVEAEQAAMKYSCASGVAARPRCWFKPLGTQ